MKRRMFLFVMHLYCSRPLQMLVETVKWFIHHLSQTFFFVSINGGTKGSRLWWPNFTLCCFSIKSQLIFSKKINSSISTMLSHPCNTFRQSTIQHGGIDTDCCLHGSNTFLGVGGYSSNIHWYVALSTPKCIPFKSHSLFWSYSLETRCFLPWKWLMDGEIEGSCF